MEKRDLETLWVGIKLVQPLWRLVWKYLGKLQYSYHRIQHFHFWEHSQKKRKLSFIAAPFTVIQTLKQHKYPSTDDWLKKIWYINKIGRASCRERV